jgi:two-component system sensor histidine kinase CreC
MSRRTRVFIGILLAYALGVGALMYRLMGDIDPRYRESAEESLVETAHLVAATLEQSLSDGAIQTQALRPVFESLYQRRFEADIFGFVKTRVEMRVMVVDQLGMVLFDSLGRHEGKDFSQWRDVRRALAGEYGARTSPDFDDDANSSVMFVSVPVRAGSQIIGAVSVGKPVHSLGQFVEAARRKTLLVGLTSVVAVLLLAVILSVWLVRPFGVVADYVRYVRAQRTFSLPRLGRRALGAIGEAYDEMRDALAGRNHVTGYVQTLAHELKSPLSAIRGASELLHESSMPEPDRQRFLGNIERETQRIQELVDPMMELAALESRRSLDTVAPVVLGPLLEELVASAQGSAAARGIGVVLDPVPPSTVYGDAFLLRRAVSNLLDNAIDFSPDGGTVRVSLVLHGRTLDIRVRDQGPGIPAYADEKVFEKFFSLARPHSSKRSTGLGLTFVKEIAELHHGRVSVRNAPDGGALAQLSLPREVVGAAL